ncbi:tryptophan 2,3-dioxygenase family protein [Phytohabitans sp. ZYX-F-186]|uniref:Tryptophan 2,3-dioxygenase n=1 Tax=Phytohabitans maris TaxID=3071409 RepID=A0ABU0ZCX2_9ACTN|nr:tryptophan 2,3-dioxygenase family protein [Phytohabitans sp. ZYX-F-186]MDQ7904900.1 tryptophan 2,3-dioxygenase family protein [Phytohabitans sp. ZYX-F-186]
MAAPVAVQEDGEIQFAESAPYDEYVHASTLHTLQRTISDDPGEMSFLVVSQIMELYFGLIRFELREAQRLVRDDDVWGALEPLRRAGLHLEGLNGSWRTLRWMSPADFNRFRGQLGEASGFQSAMYRHMEFALGLKSEPLIRPFRRQKAVYADLTRDIREPSLWDEVIALLARRGNDIPAEALHRDRTRDHEPHPAVEDAWVRVYAEPNPGNDLWLLAEALTEIGEQFSDWRYLHLKAVLRTLGDKPGTAGSSGANWLRRSMGRSVFPELWSARTHM